MKIFQKILLVLIFASYALVFKNAFAASSLKVTTDKSTAKVGDTIQIRVALDSKPDKASSISLYVSDVVVNQDNYNLHNASLKDNWDVSDLDTGTAISFPYNWDTKAAQSKAGTHYISAIMTYNDFTVPESSNVLTYTLTASDGTSTTGSGDTLTTGSSEIPTEEKLRTAGKLGDYITLLIKWAIPFGVGAGALVIVYAGYVYMTGQGSPESTKYAKELILGVIVGLAIIILAGVILQNAIGVPATLTK